MNIRAVRQLGSGMATAVSLLALSACQTTRAAVPGAPPPPQPEVSVITVGPERVALTSEWIATLDGYVNAQIHPQVSGYLVRRNYREGAAVHKGDVLFEIDARPLTAVLTQATAQVAQAEAQLAKSARDVERDTPLAAQQAIAQSQLDTEIQAYRAAEANVQSLKAAMETARLNVGFTKVTSLIDGVAAIATAQIGDLVGPATLLTTVSQVSPIKAYFAVSELDYLQMAGRINGGGKAPWAGGAALTLALADGSVYPRSGSFLAADREIDGKTGTIRLSATFPNPDAILRPGQYGRVRAETHVRTDALLVPQRAVSELQGSFQLRVVGPDNKVFTKRVKVGDRIGSRWIIAEGLQPGARVVVEGARAPDGTVVNPKPFTAPTEGYQPMSAFFIRRPIVAIVIAIVTVLGGLVAMRALPIAQFPEIVPPQITVTATYNGADALTIEQAVAAPLEQQMNGVDNMLYMQSTNANDGTMQLVVTFDVSTDPNIDQVNVQNRIAQAQPNLPPDVNTFGLTLRKATGFPMLIMSLSSPADTYDALFLANYANINITDALYRVPGVGEVRLFGAADYAMRIWVKPDRLAKLGLTVPELVRAVQQQSTVNPSGRIGGQPVPPGQEFSYTVRAQGRLQTAEEFGGIAVRSNPDGSVVRLSDVARIELGALNYGQIGRVNGKPGCAVAVFQTPGSNALAVAAGVKKTMTELSRRFPPDLQYRYSIDTTLPVSEGIKEILITLSIAIVLVMFVVYLFLQNWRATFIPMIAVPVSLIGKFAIFPLLGFSINTLSLFGLVLAIGLVVDDAIVVVEAVEHHIEDGLSPKDATVKAMQEVSGPVVSIALILAAVFIPVGFMSGIQGRLNKQFAITIAISVMISAFNALTLSPALSAMLLKPRQQATGVVRRLFAAFNRGFETATHGYVRVSRGLVRKAVLGIALLAGITVLAAGLGRRLPASFVPEEDYGYFLITVQLPPAASLERTDAVARKIDQLLARTEGIGNFNTIAGFSLLSRVTADNYGFYFVGLKPWGERRRTDLDARHIVNRVNAGLRQTVPEATAFAAMPPSIPGLGTQGGFSFWLQDRTGGSLEFLNQNVQAFLDAARKRPELVGLASQFTASVPQLFADVDRDKVLKQGVVLGDVYQTMQAFLGGLFVNQFSRFGRQWRVFLEAEGADRTSPSAIAQFYVRNNDGSMVPLSALETTKPAFGPQYTNRFNVYRGALVTGAAASGYSSGQALDALEDTARRTLPPEISFDWSDLSYQERNAGGSGPLFALSITFVFLILAALYESWSLPFSVLLSVPIAVFGAVVGLFVRHYDFDVYAQIGVIMLIGLAAKNAILIVEFAKARLEEGMSVVEAALEGAKLRLRPILMTSFAFILGCVPLWVATGSGAASRRILGTVVITGMLAATALAIFIIPLLFVLTERLASRLTRQAHASGPAPAPLEGKA